MDTLRLLRVLVAIADAGSVTRAAERLHVTQPALSASLRALRERFDDPLFVRRPQGLVATDRANEILAMARQVLSLSDQIWRDQAPFDPAHDPLSLRIEVSDFIHTVLIPQIAGSIITAAPAATLSVRPLIFDGLADRLAGDDLDCAVIPASLAPPELLTRTLFNETFGCLMRRGHPIEPQALSGALSAETFAGCEEVRVSPAPQPRPTRIDDLLAARSLRRNVRVTVTSYGVAQDIVAMSDLIALFPISLAPRLDDRLAIHPLDLPLKPMPVALVWHPRRHPAPDHRWARDFIAEATAGVLQD